MGWLSRLFSSDRVRTKGGLVNAQWTGAHVANTAAQNDAALAAAVAEAALPGGGSRGVYLPAMDGEYSFNGFVAPGSRFVLAGDVGTRLFHEGAGAAVLFDGGPNPGDPVLFGCGLQNLVIRGNALSTQAVEWRGVAYSRMENVVGYDVTADAFLLAFGVGNRFDGLRCSVNEQPFARTPSRGLQVTRRGAAVNENATGNNFYDCRFDGLGGGAVGVLLDYSDSSGFWGLISQSNAVGIQTTANGGQNTCWNFFGEGNATEDVLDDGFWNWWCNGHGNTRLHFGPHTYACHAVGGAFLNILVDENVGVTDQGIDLDRVAYGGPLGAGSLVDNGRNTRKRCWQWTAGTYVGHRTFTWGPGPIAPGGFASHTEVGITDVTMGEITHVTCEDLLPDGVEIYANVVAADQIRVTAVNHTGAPVTLQTGGGADFTFHLNRW